MIETDYVWMKPLAAPGRAEDPAARALAFPFGYIQPTHPNAAVVMRKMYPESRGPLSDIPNSGPAPVLMRMDDWVKVRRPGAGGGACCFMMCVCMCARVHGCPCATRVVQGVSEGQRGRAGGRGRRRAGQAAAGRCGPGWVHV